MRIALTIAGSDSGGGAGIQADIRTFMAHGVFGTSAITAVTAQNTLGVTAFEAVSPTLVAAQIGAVASDLGVHGAKTGMLPTAPVVEAVASAVAEWAIPHLVVDPVMVAKSGDRLLDDAAVATMVRQLLPLAEVITPNIPEAEVLVGQTIRTEADRYEAARRLHALGPRWVVVKGGHAPGDEIADLVFDGQRFAEYRVERVPGRHTHGTGCTFAAAVAAGLALGRSVEDAVAGAQAYVAGALRHAPGLGRGHGPMDHGWRGIAGAGGRIQ
ncbi:MAG: bifunctional hydroxymethylpyrimidine kinase/phosphomethylpyrimidine kinase [Acidobacteria bacterium]|nr:bifunctional hydroxymethylpyrimidine kinase/phosphomethylpyrimidine kinase [Acidobacteriota bacterium]